MLWSCSCTISWCYGAVPLLEYSSLAILVNWFIISFSVLKSWVFLGRVSAEYCEKYAKPEDAGVVPEDKSSDEELSEEEDDSGDEEILGKPDP
jgi:hypothetical protein